MFKYSLESTNQAIDILEYKLYNTLPKAYQSSSPTIEETKTSIKDLEYLNE